MHRTTARFARPRQDDVAAAVVSRRPILDHCERVLAYELLTRPAPDPRTATASVLAQAIVDIGLPRLVGNRPAHVDVSRSFLLSVRPLPFSAERVVLEVDARQTADELLLAVLVEARDQGFRITLDGFHEGAGALLDAADSVKLDLRSMDVAALEARADLVRSRGLALIADGVETRAQYALCRSLGFDAFQGGYFAEPVVVSGTSAPTYRLRALSLLAAREATSFEQIERVIKEDPGLSLKLVKLANSAFFGGRHQVASVRQALMALGSTAVRRWATMLVLAGGSDRPTPVLELGLLRARLCELIAARTGGADPARAFTVGLFSVADALLGMRMASVLAELPFDERTTRALAGHTGPEGRILAGVLAYESANFDGCAAAGVSLVDLAHAFGEALDWADGAVVQLTA
jgi:EAL and modified HD-GYP domain-containing signal transduction protein